MTVRRVPQDFKPTVWYEPKLHVSDMVQRKTSMSSAVVGHNGQTDTTTPVLNPYVQIIYSKAQCDMLHTSVTPAKIVVRNLQRLLPLKTSILWNRHHNYIKIRSLISFFVSSIASYIAQETILFNNELVFCTRVVLL
jgi:hypothetical protein